MELRLVACKEEVRELRAALDLLSSRLGMLEESSVKKDKRIRELELQVEQLNDWDAEVTVSLCEFDSFLIKHNLRLDEFEEKMEAAVENLQESVQETRLMVEVHYKQLVNWRRSWIDTAVSNSNKIIGLDNLYDEMAEYLGEEIHCSHCNNSEDNVFHGVGDRHHPGFSHMVLESCSPSPSPIVWTCASSLVSQDLLQPMVVCSPHRGLHLIWASSHSTPYSYHSPGSSSSSMASSVGSHEHCVCTSRDSSDRGAVTYNSESEGTAVGWAFIHFAV